VGVSGGYPGWRGAEIIRVPMKISIRLLLTVIVIAIGLIVLLGFFIDLPILKDLRTIFLRWAIILAAVAMLVGLFNLAAVHWRKMGGRQPGGFYSAVLLISMVVTLVIGLFFGPTSTWSLWIFNYIQVPVESSLMAVLAVVLVYASARLFNRRINLFSFIFLATTLIILVGTATIPGLEIPGLVELRSWISQVPAAGGARGILLGVALGTIATGLRVLIGADRPYGG
jgi:hypothetical protein